MDSISIGDIDLYRPSINISAQYQKDTDDNDIGRIDTVSITDTVFYSDHTGNLLGLYNDLIELLNGSAVALSYPGNSGTTGRVKSLSSDPSSDFVNQFIYTIVLEAYPVGDITTIDSYSGLAEYKIYSLTETESIDYPYDITGIQIPVSSSKKNIYYNKPIVYNYSLQVSCDGIENANKVLEEKARVIPGSVYSNYNFYIINSINKSSASDGSQSLTVKTLLFPPDASGVLLIDEQISKSENNLMNYRDRSYRITFKRPQGDIQYRSSGTAAYTVTGLPEGIVNNAQYFQNKNKTFSLSNESYNAAYDLMQYFISQEKLSGVSQDLPYVNLNRDAPCIFESFYPPIFDQIGCYNTKSITLENNISDNSATLDIQQTTQNIGNCDTLGYKVDYNINRHSASKVVNEIPGWNISGYIVQDMNTYKSNYYEYSIDVTNIYKKADISLIDKAKQVFSGIDILQGSGVITSYNINVKDYNSCSLKITQYP